MSTDAKTAPRRTRREQRAASQQGLLDAALSLFVSRGYEQSTVDQVAERAGLTKGAVYFYFRSKEDLLMALLDRAESVVVERMLERLAAAGPGPTQRMATFINGQAALGVTAPESVLLLILISLEFHGAGGPIEARCVDIYARMYAALEDVIEAGKRAGEFRTDIPTKEQAAILVGAHDGTFLEWYRRKSAFDGEQVVRSLRTSMLAGLGADPMPRAAPNSADDRSE